MEQKILKKINENSLFQFESLNEVNYLRENPLLFLINLPSRKKFLDEDEMDYLIKNVNYQKISSNLVEITKDRKDLFNDEQLRYFVEMDLLNLLNESGNSDYKFENIFDNDGRTPNILFDLIDYRVIGRQPQEEHIDLLLNNLDLDVKDDNGFTVGAHYFLYKNYLTFELNQQQEGKMEESLLFIEDDVLKNTNNNFYVAAWELDEDTNIMEELLSRKNKAKLNTELNHIRENRKLKI